MQSGIYFYSDEARQEMAEIINGLPEDVNVYLVGGALRNALIHKYHGESWLQRDYDQIVTSNSEKYFSYLYARGYHNGSLNRPTQRVVVKPLIDSPKAMSYDDNLVFDIHMVDGTSVEDNLQHDTGLLINGFALSLRDIFSPEWEEKLIQLPGALDSIKSKQIRINPNGYASEANNFFACMRFVGAGFAAPPENEVLKLLGQLPKLEHDRYQRNLEKLSNYVGGESEARRIIEKAIGPELDIFDEPSTKRIISSEVVY